MSFMLFAAPVKPTHQRTCLSPALAALPSRPLAAPLEQRAIASPSRSSMPTVPLLYAVLPVPYTTPGDSRAAPLKLAE